MSKKERVIARIDLLKVLIVAFLGALFAVFGYTALHYKEFDLVLGILVGVGAILLIVGISVFIIIYERIGENVMIGIIVAIIALLGLVGTSIQLIRVLAK